MIEKYLRSVLSADTEVHEGWILSQVVLLHFHGENVQCVQHLTKRIIELSEFVQLNLGHFGDESEQVVWRPDGQS